jgi:hypothetical protein
VADDVSMERWGGDGGGQDDQRMCLLVVFLALHEDVSGWRTHYTLVPPNPDGSVFVRLSGGILTSSI